MDVIRPLLEREHNEVLLNFMISHIRRFMATEDSSASFVRLFGHDIREELEGLEGEAREERAVGEYMRSLKRAGNFLYVGSAIVLKPEIDATQFHLIYATRSNKGVEKFKEVEKKMFGVATDVRASAKQRKVFEKTGQTTFFDDKDLHPPTWMMDRRTRYLAMARKKVHDKLVRSGRIRYEIAWRMALAYPLIWSSDVKGWVEEWRAAASSRYRR